MLTRRDSRRSGSTTPRPNVQKANNGSNEIKVKKDSNRVKVFVRVRPFSKDERARISDDAPFEISEDSTQLHIFADERGHTEKTYCFDQVFSSHNTNKEVSGTLTQPLVKAAMNGFNGTLMAYGQTGAGKTHSLMSDDGITKTLVEKCFAQICDDIKHNYKVTVSYLQIYQEKIFDLLSGVSNSKGDLAIRENPRTGVYVDNLSDYVVRSPSEVLQYIANGKKKLVFAETKMNRMSSRSHAVLQMTIERTMKDGVEMNEKITDGDIESGIKDPSISDDNEVGLDLNAFGKDVIIRGKIYICDLAGSERIKRTGASGDRLNEAQHINSSLLELGNVIQALADESKKHVPFRNSVLTRLLQESLGGNCKTSLIVCISPSTRDLPETKCTLNFGSRAMKVTNTAYVNMEVDFKSLSDQLLKQLQSKEDEIHKIRQSIKEQIERECKQIKDEYEGTNGKLTTLLNEQENKFEDEICTLQRTVNLLTDENNSKSQEIKDMEEAVFLMDDNSRSERSFILHLLESEKNIATFSSTTSEINKNDTSQQRLSHIVSTIENKMNNFSDENLLIHEAIELLISMQNELDEKLSEETTKQLNSLLQNENGVTDFPLGEDFYSACIKLFLSNRVQQFKELYARLDEMNLIKKEAIKAAEEIDATKDKVDGPNKVTDSAIQTVSSSDGITVGIQTVSGTQATKSNVVGSCTVASQEKRDIGTQSPQPSIKMEEVEETNEKHAGSLKDAPEINAKKTFEIFQGFNTTLNRIEDLVKTDRIVSRTPSYNLGSLSSRSECVVGSSAGGGLAHRSDGGSYRSTSSLGFHRYEDSYISKYSSSPYTTSYSGSSTRLNTDTYESKYTPRSYAGPTYTSSKYDHSRSYGGSSLSKFNSSDNLLHNDSKDGFTRSSGDLTFLNPNKNEIKNLEEKIKELEDKVKEVQQENDEYQVLVQELSRNFPNDEQLKEIKRKVTSKVADCIIMGNRKETIKVARIEPFSNEKQQKSNNFNVKYDFVDGKSINPRADTKDSNVTYDIHVNVVRNITKRNNMRASPSNLIEFSPDNEQAVERLSSRASNKTSEEEQAKEETCDQQDTLSAAVFEELNKRSTWTEPMKRKNYDRPQTWYEGANTPDINDSRRYGNNLKKASDLGRLDINPYKSEEVVFATKRSSLMLPDWMRLKKKSTASQSSPVITTVIQ